MARARALRTYRTQQRLYSFDGLSARADEAPVTPRGRPSWLSHPPAASTVQRDPHGVQSVTRDDVARAHTSQRAKPGAGGVQDTARAVGAWGSHCARTAHPSLPWPRPNTAIARSCKAPRAHGLEGRDIRQGRTDPDQSLRFWCKALKRHGFLRAPTRMDWCNGPYSTPPARQRAALARCQMCRIPCRGTG